MVELRIGKISCEEDKILEKVYSRNPCVRMDFIESSLVYAIRLAKEKNGKNM